MSASSKRFQAIQDLAHGALFSFLVPHGPQQRLSDLKSSLDVIFSGDVSLRSLRLVWSGLVSSERVRVKDPALTVLYFPTVVLSNSVCV